MTGFDGFRFGDGPYTDDEGKRVLCSAMEALRARNDLRQQLHIDPGPGKSKITKGQVWDVIRFQDAPPHKAFNKYPHLTLGIDSGAVSAYATLPNAAPARMRESLLKEGLPKVVGAVLDEMRPLMNSCEGMVPRLHLRHREWPRGIGGPCVYLAHHDVDLHVLRGDAPRGVKQEPYKITSVSIALKKKKKSGANLELQIGALFFYRTCPVMREPDGLDHIAAAWIACKPFIKKLGVGLL